MLQAVTRRSPDGNTCDLIVGSKDVSPEPWFGGERLTGSRVIRQDKDSFKRTRYTYSKCFVSACVPHHMG